ncbi:WD40/YVTN/BNR-like repeat-containing protein [Lentiprolixibacter aurantiacus]|uniref:Sortilin N-terminal domain-containing protein n=1 Tax=Lentiprolixibacter aurantiacus TaxID=2993939 RepID=A0AAE3MLD1_9FLAO|nr:hypothetical protein [Lentiprolixibacter aurantiacus]MCX2719569.1 hypothetical protein [Lentiprolixibacter aurantiacus]
MKKLYASLLSFLAGSFLFAQDFSVFEYRNVGPYRGGRVTTVAGIASEPGTFYFGATGGGVWKTTDYGTSWNNISDGFFKTPSIGAIAVAQNDPNILYVGTGSDGLRSNLIEGKGMYKSIDAGENWMEIGLENTGQIGGVRIHPQDHNTVYVAAIGRAFQSNPERGVYKTTDGGKNWKKVLFISERTGVSDVEFLPSNPNIIFAAAWKAERKPWTIISGGTQEEGGIYKSIDGGQSWNKVYKGLPGGLIGKIDIEVCPSDSRIVYALVEAPGDEGGLYKSVDQGETFTHISSNGGIRTRPFYYTNLKVDPKNPDILYAMATGYFKSTDGGKNWSRMRPPHGDNHDMWINPNNTDLFIQSNDGGANVTHNGGETWSTQFNQPTAEIYQVEVDTHYPYWLYGGQQDNFSTIAVPSMPPYGVQANGIGYIINTGGCETGPAVPHPTNPEIVYSNCKGRFTVYNKRTGTEQSYYVGAGNMYGHNPKDLRFRFQRVSPIHISPHDPSIIYHTSQYVHMTTDEGKTWNIISPDLTAYEADKQVISGSPITRDITGEEFYSTIYAIRESPVKQGVIWVGANDGPVHVTQDGGKTWTNVTPKKLPPGGRVDAVEPSPHDPAKAYISVLRYQLGDRRPYIYKTENFGKSWTLLSNGFNGIPADYPSRVVREDPVREGLLFAGTEYGMFVSLDDGRNWRSFQQNLPITPVTDLKIHRGDLAISTMGRSFWVLDNIESLRFGGFATVDYPVLLPRKKSIRYRMPSGAFRSNRPVYPGPSVIMDYYLSTGDTPVQLEIRDSSGSIIAFTNDSTAASSNPKTPRAIRDMSTEFSSVLLNQSLTSNKGWNRFKWDMRMMGPWNKSGNRRFRNGPLVKPGKYEASLLTPGNKTIAFEFEIIADPRILESGVSLADIDAQVDLQIKVRDKLSEALHLQDKLEQDLKALEKAASVLGSDKQKKANIEGALAQLKTKDGIYEQPMLVAQLRYLYSMLNQADQIPGKDAYDRYGELVSWLMKVKNEVE